MILKDTILSAFTDRGTLLKWLKKVEAALKSDVLTDISVTQVSETQIKLKFTFANGDYVESPVLTLPRGEKGDKGDKGDTGATGATPNISVTATELPAGSPPTATRSGTDENPLITFGIPKAGGGTQLYKHEFETDNNTYSLITCISNRQETYNNIEDLHNDFGNIIQVYLPFYGNALMALSTLKTSINFLIVNKPNETSGTTTFTINSISGDLVTPL